MDLYGRSVLSVTDLSAQEFMFLVEVASKCRAEKQMGFQRHRLAGRSIALIFERASTETRPAFEVAAHDEGAHVTYLGTDYSQPGRKEAVKDTARVLGRMFDGIEYRGFSQADVEVLAKYAGVPVWNGLTDDWHPTQMLADIMTMRDHARKELSDVSYCYVGNGQKSIANSLLVTGALLGLDTRICAPSQLQPSRQVRDTARQLAAKSDASITVTDDIADAVRGADYLYTDVWISAGEPLADWGQRITLLLPYQVSIGMLAATGNPAVKFMHCLPAMHNRGPQLGQQINDEDGPGALEVTDDVFESPASIVFDQAENRMHTIKATMLATIPPPDGIPSDLP